MSQIIPVPVQLNVETSSEQYALSVSEQNIPISFQIGTEIVVGTTASYEGPYSVTPTEEQQTLATAELKMDQDVTVGAIPSDYVGSDVPREHAADVTVSGSSVTAPAGYYEESVTKSVQSGSVSVPSTSITANPSLTITQNTGMIESSVSASQSIDPSVSEGYVTSGASGTVSVSGSNHYDLPTQVAATITPSETAQTAVPAHKWTTGAVDVAAIPSDYVGSSIARNDSSDLTSSGATVTAPAGYYPDAATKDVEAGVRGNRVNTIGYSGTKKTYKISYPDATSGYYAAAIVKEPGQFELERQQETVTPTESAQEVTPTNSLYYLEKVTVNPIPTDYGKIEQNGSVLTIS